MGVCQFHLNLIAVHPYLGNSFQSISLPNSGSLQGYTHKYTYNQLQVRPDNSKQ